MLENVSYFQLPSLTLVEKASESIFHNIKLLNMSLNIIIAHTRGVITVQPILMLEFCLCSSIPVRHRKCAGVPSLVVC